MNDRYLVIDANDSIYKEGTKAECSAFLVDPTTKEIAEAGGLALSIVSFGEWMQRNVYDGSGDRFTDPTEDAGTDPGQDPERPEDPAEGVQLPTREEMQAFWQHQRELDDWAHSLSAEQRNRLCDMGYYNDAMKGYALFAAREMSLTEDQSRELLRCFSYALDMMNKEEAERLYINNQY